MTGLHRLGLATTLAALACCTTAVVGGPGTALAASRAQLCQALRRTRIMRHAEAASRVVVSSKSP